MSKRSAEWGSAVFLTLDLEQKPTNKGWLYTVHAERPGRSGSFSKTWTASSGRLTHDQALDLVGWLNKTVYNALAVWGGIEEPPDER